MKDRSERELDDLLLERLVDGELSMGEYRGLLAELEQRPDGWRRCAMAFLEDQAWGREVRSMRRQFDEPVEKPASVSTLRRAWNIGGFLTLACAASFVLAYVLATSMMGNFRNSNAPGADIIVRTEPTTKTPAVATTESSMASKANAPVGQYVVEGPTGQIQMPIYEANDPRAEMVMDERASMPVEFIRDIERKGYEVERQRHWAIGEQAGNSVLFPIEDYEIRPISGRSFH